MHLLQEIISLFTSRRFIAPEMIYTTDKTKIASLIEIRTEILIQPAGALSALNDDKTHRASLNHCILKLFPIYFSLIMRYIYTMNFISFRINLITIKCTPSKTGRTYKKMVKQKHIQNNNCYSTKPPSPTGITAPKPRRTPRPTSTSRSLRRGSHRGRRSFLHSTTFVVVSLLVYHDNELYIKKEGGGACMAIQPTARHPLP